MGRGFIALIAALGAASPGRAAIVHVPSEQPTIQAGIAAAAPGDTILLANGSYVGPGNDALEFDKILSMISEGRDPFACVLAGASIGFDLEPPVPPASWTVLESLGLLNAHISTTAEALRLVNCRITGTNSGTFVHGSAIELRGCLIQDNVGLETLGSANDMLWGIELYDCVIADNAFMGPMLRGDGRLTIDGCTIVNNSSTSALVWASMFLQVDMEICTIAHNLCSMIFWRDGSLILVDKSLIGFNECNAIVDGSGDLGTILGCTDIFGNSGGDWVGEIADQLWTQGNLWADPEFCGVPGSGNFYLQSDSPCAPGGNECSVQIGARPVGCESVGMRDTSWGAIKAQY